MSASLVGSEMCIRDRRRRRTRQRARGAARPRPCSACGPRPRNPRSWGTVSYTHLTLPTICSV
eukprot:7102182-Alexandrium_andersonii.AAC.1